MICVLRLPVGEGEGREWTKRGAGMQGRQAVCGFSWIAAEYLRHVNKESRDGVALSIAGSVNYFYSVSLRWRWCAQRCACLLQLCPSRVLSGAEIAVSTNTFLFKAQRKASLLTKSGFRLGTSVKGCLHGLQLLTLLHVRFLLAFWYFPVERVLCLVFCCL